MKHSLEKCYDWEVGTPHFSGIGLSSILTADGSTCWIYLFPSVFSAQANEVIISHKMPVQSVNKHGVTVFARQLNRDGIDPQFTGPPSMQEFIQDIRATLHSEGIPSRYVPWHTD
jgi:hypothetical protein